MELWAAEPDVVDPVAMCFDEKGRLFVCEMRGYPNGGVGTGKETRGRIKCLTDDDGDGVAGQFDHDGHLGVLVGVAGDEFRIDLALGRCVVEAIDPGVGVGDGGHRQGKCARGDE